MVKFKFYMLIAVLSLAALLMVACGGEPSSPSGQISPAPQTQISDLRAKNAAEAVDVALSYLRGHEPQNAPETSLVWQEKTTSPQSMVGGTNKEFTSDDWTVRVSYAVLPLERTVYEVTVFSIKLGWYWQGSVKADGNVTELSSFRQMSVDERDSLRHEIIGDEETPVLSSPPAADMEIRQAPIREVKVNVTESYPPQVIVYIKGGLADGCTTFHELTTERSGNTVSIEVTTQRPKDAMCAQVYSYFEKSVELGSDFISGETYTIKVNDKTTSFVMQ